MNDKCKHCENKHINFTNYEGHEVSEQNHLNQNKGIDESDKAIVSEMLNVQANNKNPAYGRHQLSRPMRIEGPIQG